MKLRGEFVLVGLLAIGTSGCGHEAKRFPVSPTAPTPPQPEPKPAPPAKVEDGESKPPSPGGDSKDWPS